MGSYTLTYLLTVGLLIVDGLFLVRLYAIRRRIDPLMNRYKPESAPYKYLAELAEGHKLIRNVGFGLLVTIGLVYFLIRQIQSLRAIGTEDTKLLLLGGPIVAVISVGIIILVTYRKMR